MGPIGVWEIVVIVVVALIFVGPRKLPEAARSVGKAIRELRTHSDSVKAELREAIDLDEIAKVRDDLRGIRDFTSIVDGAGLEASSGIGHDGTPAKRADGAKTAPGSESASAAAVPDEPGPGAVSTAEASTPETRERVTRRLPDSDDET